MINQARVDFTSHINSIKAGKQLSQLPKIQVPRPPPCPKLHPMPPPPTPQPVMPPPALTSQPPPNMTMLASGVARMSPGVPQPALAHQMMESGGGVPPSPLPLERKAITPPSNRARGATTPQQMAQAPPSSQFHHHMMSPTSNNSSSMLQNNYSNVNSATSSIPNSANATPIKVPIGTFTSTNSNMATSASSSHQQSTVAPPPPPIAPIGVRPLNYQNGVAKQQQSALMQHHMQHRQSPTVGSNHASMVQQQQQQQQSVQSQFLQQQSKSAQPSTAGFQPWGGWGDNISNNISELFCQGRNLFFIVYQLENVFMFNTFLFLGRSFGPLGSDFGANAGNKNTNGSNNSTNGGFFS